MGSARRDVSSQKAIEGDLVDAGNRLLTLHSSCDELLIDLEKAESLLAKVWQRPPKSTCTALIPILKGLITDEVLRHHDINVQVLVASCFSELTRITAPDPTYDDDVMVVFFPLIMIAFNQLSHQSGPHYSRALKILETVAKVRSSLILLDIDTDGLVVEMFQLFLNSIRSSHPYDVFVYMETIMTLVIEESDEISIELLSPILASVKMDDKETSPTSWELGKRVFENCATKLQRCLKETAKAMDMEFDDYAEIVASICHDTSHEENMVSKEVSPTVGDGASPSDGLTEVMHEDSTPQNNDDKGKKLDDEDSLETLKGRQQIVQSGTDTGPLRRKRGRKPNSVIRPEEGYMHAWTTGSKYSCEVSSDNHKEEKRDLTLLSERGNGSILCDSLQKKNDSFSEGSLLKRGLPKKKKSMTNQDNDLKSSSMLGRKILQSKVKDRGHSALKKIGKRAIAGSSNNGVKNEEGILHDASTEGKYDLSPQEQYGRKELVSQIHVQKDVAEKMEEFPMSKHANVKFPRKDKEKKSRRSRVSCGEDLVNLRIQVWWPMDGTFYAGTVKDFDPVTKKHTILYDDDETEILNLRKEIWKLFVKKPPHKKEADDPSPAKEPFKSQEKIAKRKAVSSIKQNAASSSRRSKSEDGGVNKSGEPGIIRVNDESDYEATETNVPPKHGESHASKELSEALMKKSETGHIPEDVTKA